MPATILTTNTMRLAGALALTLSLAATVSAQPPPGRAARPDGPPEGFGPPPPGPGGRMMGPLGGLIALHPDLPLPGLNLSDAQREQVRGIMQSHRDDARGLMQKAQSAFDGLQKATGTTVDEGAAAQHGQALGAVIGEAAVLRARVRGEVFAILTPEQQAEASRILADRVERRGRFRRPMPARGGQPPEQRFPE